MRIVHLAAGAGGMYCGACARDTTLARGLISRGHDVQIVPLYTPLRFDGGDPLATAPVHLGGINAYIEQMVPAWGQLPGLLRRPLDNAALLNWVSRFAVSTSAADLGPMIVSVLKGVRGRQRGDVKALVRYVQQSGRPDLISITNSLLTGVAPALKEAIGVPIVCGLQGEDEFVRSSPEPYRSQAIELMRLNARSVDMLLAPSADYARIMSEFLAVAPERVRVARVGIDAAPYRLESRARVYPFTIGYLSVITPLKGLDLLIDAFIALAGSGREIELAVAGKVMNRPYWTSLVDKLEAAGLALRVRYDGEVDFEGKLRFLRGCSAFCLPSRAYETRAVSAIEAQAAGLPVVGTDSGILPEMLAATGGGITFESGNAESLATAIARLMDDPEGAVEMGARGADGVVRHFSAERLVEQTLSAFEDVLAPGSDSRGPA